MPMGGTAARGWNSREKRDADHAGRQELAAGCALGDLHGIGRAPLIFNERPARSLELGLARELQTVTGMRHTTTIWRSGAWVALGLLTTAAFAQQAADYPAQSLDA